MFKKMLCKMGIGNCGEHEGDAPMEDQSMQGPSQTMEEPTPAPSPAPEAGMGEAQVGGNEGPSPFTGEGEEAPKE